MLLAEALAERAEAQRRLEQVQVRIHRILRVQEGEDPPESPDKVLTEMDKILDRLQMLVRRINKTNSITAIDDYQSIADAIAHRDIALRRRKLYSDCHSSKHNSEAVSRKRAQGRQHGRH